MKNKIKEFLENICLFVWAVSMGIKHFIIIFIKLSFKKELDDTIRMGPNKTYKVKAKITSIKKAVPKIVE